MDAGTFALRLILAAVLGVHASQKWWGWFNGPGLDEAARIFRRLGQLPPRPMVRMAATMELLAALLLLLGLATPLGAVIAAATLGVAGTAQFLATGSLANAKGGGEYPIVLALVATTIGLIGPAAWSIDGVLDAPWSNGLSGWAVFLAVVLPILAAAPVAMRTRANLNQAHADSGT